MFCYEVNLLQEYMYRQGDQGSSIQIQQFVQWALSLALFFKYFVRKNWRDGGESLLKNGTIDGYAYWTCYSRAGFALCEAPGT